MDRTLLQPANLLLIALLLACGLAWFKQWRTARAVVTVLALIVLVSAVLPIGAWLVGPLENRFPAPQSLPESVAGIVVLGGASDEALSVARGQVVMGGAGERLLAFLELARRYPSVPLLISRGRNGQGRASDLVAALPPDFFVRYGIDPERVRVEAQSGNTAENAQFSHRLIKAKASENWLLITSAWHMPRAVGVFRSVGWRVTPYPVDYRTSGSFPIGLAFNVSRGFSLVAMGLREWSALAVYRLRGYTDTWFPASTDPVATR